MRKTFVGRLLVISVSIAAAGCRFNVGNPTDEEVQQMQAWAEVVTPKDRADVMRSANMQTEWAERKKVQWITGEYKKRYLKEQSKVDAHTPTSRSTTSTAPAMMPDEL